MTIRCLVIAIVALLAGAVPGVASAECANGSCDNVTIKKFYLTASGDHYIGTSGTESLLSPCTPDSSTYVRLSASSPNRDNILALLLSAQNQGKPVSIRVNDTAGACLITYVTLDL